MERRCKKRKPTASEEPSFACVTVVHDVPDDVLRLILLRLDSPLWLVRAACACKRWRRIIDGGDGGRAFLRLVRSFHPPVVLGHYHSCYVGDHDDDDDSYVGGDHDDDDSCVGGGLQFVPSSPAPPVRPSLDFCPSEFIQRHHHTIVGHWRDWHIAGCHGGLVLLREGFDLRSCLLVCDPMSRRCRYIYHPPELAALSRAARFKYKEPHVLLLDGGNDDGNHISISNFRVLYYCSTFDDVTDVWARCVWVFTSSADGGEWRFVRQSTDFGSYIGDDIGRIDGSLYVASLDTGSLRMLDNAKLELSKVDLPMRVGTKSGLQFNISTFAVVHGASPEPTASPATAYITHVRGDCLELFRRIPSSGEWVLEHSIPRLSEATRGLQGCPERSRWMAVVVFAGGTRLAMLRVYLTSKSHWLFSFDVDTMQLQGVPHDVAINLSPDTKPIIYTLPWPQFLRALPS